jgi:hypothetical protein
MKITATARDEKANSTSTENSSNDLDSDMGTDSRFGKAGHIAAGAGGFDKMGSSVD